MEWVTIITGFLLPFLQKCRNEQGATEDPQEYLRANYDEATETFDRDVVKAAIPQTKRAIIKAKREASKEDRKTFPRYKKADVYEMTEKGLLKAMNATAEEAKQVMAAAAELPDDEE